MMPIPGETRDPEDGFETILARGREGSATVGEALAAFADSPVIVALAEKDGVQQPVVFTSPLGGYPVVAFFTARDRMAPVQGIATTSRTLSGRQALEGITGGAGIVINPGSGLGMEIDPKEAPGILAALPPAPAAAPAYAVERAIKDAKLGVLEHKWVLGYLLRQRIYVATATAPQATMDEMKPLVLDFDGQPYVGVFTRPEHATAFSETHGYQLYIPTVDLVRPLVADLGIVINPGLDWAYRVSASELAQVRESLGV